MKEFKVQTDVAWRFDDLYSTKHGIAIQFRSESISDLPTIKRFHKWLGDSIAWVEAENKKKPTKPKSKHWDAP